MCLNPRFFHPQHVYSNNVLNSSAVLAACGKCEECRESKRNEWVNRLCFEYDDCTKNGGSAVFLTFTYNDSHLPVFEDDETGFKTLCFNHSDVLTFLGSLEDYYMHIYKRKPYRYFFAAEYGKNTQRPHYHCLFFLDSVISSNWIFFVELCREIWSKPIRSNRPQTNKVQHNFGFMFPRLVHPRYDSDGRVVSGIYVDEKGKDRTPLIMSGVKGMVYVSKYSTKDMSFYSPEIMSYLASDRGYRLKRYLPKHWQSKGIGFSAVSKASQDLNKAFSVGIQNPLSLEYVPLPNYVNNKLVYKNVWRGRFSPTGKKLYDRELSDFGVQYLAKSFKTRCIHTAHKMSVLFQLLGVSNDVKFPPETSSLLSSCGIFDCRDYRAFLPCAIYHHFYKNFNSNLYEIMLRSFGGSSSDLLTFHPLVLGFYVKSKDTNFKRLHPLTVNILKLRHHLFGNVPFLDSVYCDVYRSIQSTVIRARLKKRLQSYETKELFTHGYPLNLC